MNIGERIAGLDWPALEGMLNEDGVATTPRLLSAALCRSLSARYDDGKTAFRATIDMARYNFGRGQYRYFDYPLPAEVREMRGAFYPHLARIANQWSERLGIETTWPDSHDVLLEQCHRAGQQRPTPLMLRYGQDDYNCLHQDLYGPIHFPLQVVLLLSKPGEDFDGGELVLVEQRPRMQSRPMIVSLQCGAAAIFPVRERPRLGVRGFHRTQMRHGVSKVTRGERTTLGLIFHDAR
jgi:uncharacterized protein